MYAVAINGSPRRGGNTENLLKSALNPLDEAGWDTELVQLGGKQIRGCLACMKCKDNGGDHCAIKNDVFNEIYGKMLKADAIILGSSTYFSNVTAEMKALIDRSGYMALVNGRAFSGKIGASVVAVRRAGALPTFDAMNHLFMINGMIIPGSTYWNLGIGLKPGDVNEDAEGQRNMKNLGEMINWLGKSLENCKESFPTLS